MDFKGIVTIMFSQKRSWVDVTDADKEAFFFIFNRFMAKKYPEQANTFNTKGVDKASAMDVWFEALRKDTYPPPCFWRGPTKRKDPPIKEWQVVQDFWKVGLDDMYLLCEMFPKDVKAEIARLKLINEELEK